MGNKPVAEIKWESLDAGIYEIYVGIILRESGKYLKCRTFKKKWIQKGVTRNSLLVTG